MWKCGGWAAASGLGIGVIVSCSAGSDVGGSVTQVAGKGGESSAGNGGVAFAPGAGKAAVAGDGGTVGMIEPGGAAGVAGSGGAGMPGVAGSGDASGSGGAPVESAFDCKGSFGGMGRLGEVGAAGAAGAGGTPAAGSLTRIVAQAPWLISQEAVGMAVDNAGRVYVAESDHVYVVRDGQVSIFLTLDDTLGTVGQNAGAFYDLDIGPDQRLYLAVGNRVVRSDAPHELELWQQMDGLWYPDNQKLSVMGGGCLGVVNQRGLTLVTKKSQRLAYDAKQLGWQNGCAVEDFTLARSGVFLYQSGCNGYPLTRGQLDGSGVGTLYESNVFAPNPSYSGNFLCSARDPAGGFYIVTKDGLNNDAHLHHLTETSDQVSGYHEIATTPTFHDAKVADGGSLTFDFCSLAVAPDGAIYLQTIQQLWRIKPGL